MIWVSWSRGDVQRGRSSSEAVGSPEHQPKGSRGGLGNVSVALSSATSVEPGSVSYPQIHRSHVQLGSECQAPRVESLKDVPCIDPDMGQLEAANPATERCAP